MPISHFFAQGTPEWLDARLGVVTASEFDRVVTAKELKLASASKKYMAEKIAEWIMGAPLEEMPHGADSWVERGKRLEPEAVRFYELEKGVETAPIGFVTTDDGMIGASPDRLVGDCALAEIKCPSIQVHVSYMIDPQSLLSQYSMQVQGQMWVCQDREYNDILSYFPGLPAVVVRSYRDERVQRALSLHLPAFVETMLRAREALIARYGELRRERIGAVKAEEHLEARRAAFDSFMASPIGGNV